MDEHPQRDPGFMSTLRRLLELGREQSIAPTARMAQQPQSASDAGQNSEVELPQ